MTKNADPLIVELDTGGTGEISFRATGVAEYWRSQQIEELGMGKSTEPIVMDTDRQKLELDITQEFEVADDEATSLIDETK